MKSRRAAWRSIFLASLTFSALIAVPSPAAAATPLTEAQRVIAVAKKQLGDRWAFNATGPNTFDCSGLVTFAFRETGLIERIGGGRRSAAGFYNWFNDQGRANKTVGQPGDLIVWGANKHIGIYLGGGMAISTLINPHGVSIHPVLGYLGMPVKAYLHVQLTR